MNTLIIALKILKQNFTQPANLIILVIVPLVLIQLLGTALSGVFSASNNIAEISLAYQVVDKGPIGEAFEHYLKIATKNSSDSIDNRDEGLKQLEQAQYQAFVVMDEKAEKIDLYFNNAGGISAGIIESLIRAFVNDYDFKMALNMKDSEQAEIPIEFNENYFIDKTLNRTVQADSMDHMAILMLSMFVLFGAFLVSYTIETEKANLTINRIYSAPVKKESIFLGIYIGNFVSQLAMVLCLFLLSNFLLGIYFGENILKVLLILLSEVFLSVSIGMALAMLIKDTKALKALLNVLILSFVFFAGGYGPLPEVPFFQTAKLFSPMTWVKEGLFEVIFNGSSEKVMPAILICFGFGLLLMGLSFIVTSRRKEI
ncbi:MAG: ABC transporter permease [Spirochaetales bacterium]|nr:ABC transporter permease [Spirochaetales bacterium]